MNFIILDLVLLAICIVAVTIFLVKHKHNLKRDGLMYLYRTQLGVKYIDKFSKKYSKILKPLQYLVIISGFILMFAMIWLLGKTLIIYLQQPDSSPIAKVPAVFPLIPYFPQLFNLDSLFPPFYFIYFIIAIAIVAIVHEAAHGILARLNNIKIHSTGFAFLGPFLGAFVEQDDKQMNKAGKKEQMAILAAGTFANVLTAIITGIILIIFFKLIFFPAGFIFTSYANTAINISDIQSIAGTSDFQSLLDANETLLEVITENKNYLVSPVSLAYSLSTNNSLLLVYENAPAINANLSGAIIEIDNTKINSYETLGSALDRHNPGDTINIKTVQKSGEIQEYTLILGERNGKAFLGIGAQAPYASKGVISKWYLFFSKFKDPLIYYESRIGDYGQFIYDLLWWVAIINILVALFNMFPAGMLDGGRFLYLAVWGATGNKKAGEYSFKIMTWVLLILLAIMMVKWVFAFI